MRIPSGAAALGPALLLSLLVVAAPARGGWHPLSRGATPTLTLREPYRPGAYPVVLVHGMASTNATWEPMIARIKADPVLGPRFQFWLFSYDSCSALPLSAGALRSALVRTRWALDPAGADPALDRMVLVGQSQGGLLAKTAAQESGWALWDATFAIRPEGLACSPETRAALVDAFVSHRVPSVARLVFVATPHHGSHGPAVATARLKERVIGERREAELAGPIAEVRATHGPEVFVSELRRVPIGSVGSLAWDSPMLDALRRVPVAPDVPAHSIIPQLGTWRHHLRTDGVVAYDSSHLDWADSEVIVPGSHIALRRPEVAAELSRILRIHLEDEARGATSWRVAPGGWGG